MDDIDPFIGTAPTALPPAQGLAATWWWPKAQIGNTHPGAVSPLGMVSACAYSGAYPTGYGLYTKNTEGLPDQMFDHPQASGFTHFQQSGTGAIRKYYNYVRVTPMVQPLDTLGQSWPLHDETAEAGYYAATLDPGIRCEITVGAKVAVHRYTFPEHRGARVVVDLSCGGLAIDHGRTVPLRAHVESLGHGRAQGTVVVEGVPLSVYIEVDSPDWRQMVWHDRRLIEGGTRLDFDRIRQTTLRPFGLLFIGQAAAGQSVEVRIGFSLRGCEQARENLRRECGEAPQAFDTIKAHTQAKWRDHVGRIEVEGGSPARRQVFATALYHSLVKPCFGDDESPFWPTSGPFAFDVCTMWDIYKTQLPLLMAICPDRAVDLLESLIRVCEEEGNFPIGYRMARGADRFFRQASALTHTALADAHAIGLGDLDWNWALVHMVDDLRRMYGEDFYEHGVVHPISHTLDLAYAYHCTSGVARAMNDVPLAKQLDERALLWPNAFDPATGLLHDSSFYEGGKWNYSFRLMHDMAGRIALAGGDEKFVAMLDAFFGYGAARVVQPGHRPDAAQMAVGYALNRFEGLNNEPDMEAPWSYHYAGRPDRTAEVVHAALTWQFGTGPGGLPGNDDSGGLSSWYVWASLGLFPVAGQSLFLVNAPAFARSTIHVGDKDFVIETSGHRETPISSDGLDRVPPPQYVQSARLNGKPLEVTHLSASDVHAGGTLHLELGPEPSRWGRATRPPSLSTGVGP
ncbi:Putative alpha-1,2-mannosidase [Actinokineospora alba]|uniref:Putative alpha-1,2-mannosidase n=1 Tax=Actinokineospora alba TaxID=504798 RepID=A0A1H0GCM9_9PSEU|nr:GH92 family glycosyl hydrolase [Actinokineospora alba]TDP69843.1 putative alpha-1,2-mannosidase [Actinokineospora alba]SDI07475.1 Putative alpha-1,2-mannosidase [Actinokineospora alba]SDO04591.1 Putative alpha-1,2-mannosidase [Actinokineospora alba]